MTRLKVVFIVALLVIRDQITAQGGMLGAPVILKTDPEHKQTAMEGSSTTIVCTDHGAGRVHVHWTRGGALPMPFDFKQTAGRLTIPVVQVAHQGAYICAPLYLLKGETTNQTVFLHVRRKDECHEKNEWSECEDNCTQTRVCHLRPAHYTSDEDCDENQIVSLLQRQQCPGCQVGGWGDWSDWTGCSTSCGLGSRNRFRRCDNPAPRGGGSYCDGLDSQYESCVARYCPVDCAWTSWSVWSECSASCGRGTRMRSRTRHVHAAQGGRDCVGLEMEDAHCDARSCPHWSTWSVWSPCSRTCGDGYRRRHRDCLGDEPTRSVSHCDGPAYEDQYCSSGSCRTDGNWSPWDDWSSCSVSCGIGSRHRRRYCNNPPPSSHGAWCRGDDVEDEPCILEQCPVVPCVTHGGWSAWSPWGECSNITRTKSRRRSCDNPAPVNGGSNCTGDAVERKKCSVCPCSVSVRLFPGRKNLSHNTPALFKCSYHSPYNESVNIRMTTTPNIATLLSLHKQTTLACGAVRRLTIIRVTLQTAVLCEVLAANGTRVGSATFKISVDNATVSTSRPFYTRATKSYGKKATTMQETWTKRPRTDGGASGVCDEKEFLCPSSMCIPLALTCNGEDDCGDNADEMACQHGLSA